MSTSILICVADAQYMPEKKTPGAACRDLRATETTTIAPHTIAVVGTGVKTYLPEGWHTKLYARSGLPRTLGLIVINGTAIIDSDYRGEYFIQLYNFTDTPVIIEAGHRIIQLELARTRLPGQTQSVTVPELHLVIDPEQYTNFAQIYPSLRGEGGFNSTGLH